MAKEFILRWDTHTLFGCQYVVYDKKLESIVRGIRAGDVFPAVPVFQLDENVFKLAYSVKVPLLKLRPDGGHHRSRAHFDEGVPLRCKLYDRNEVKTGSATLALPDLKIRKIPRSFLRNMKKDPIYR